MVTLCEGDHMVTFCEGDHMVTLCEGDHMITSCEGVVMVTFCDRGYHGNRIMMTGLDSKMAMGDMEVNPTLKTDV